MPDSRIQWNLDRREKRASGEKDPDIIPAISCPGCTALIEKIHKACPYCGYVREPLARTSPKFVDGDLMELDPETLRVMRGEVDRIDQPAEQVRSRMEKSGYDSIIARSAEKKHRERQEAQTKLRHAMALWGGYQRDRQRPDSESYRRFYLTFGTDVLTAQALGRPEAEALTERINNNIGRI
jgi:hypothetical protein